MTILNRIITVVREHGAITLQDIYKALPDIDESVIRGVINRYVKRPDSKFNRCSRGLYVTKCEDSTNIISLANSEPMKQKTILSTFKQYISKMTGQEPIFNVKMAAGVEQLSLDHFIFQSTNETTTTTLSPTTSFKSVTPKKKPSQTQKQGISNMVPLFNLESAEKNTYTEISKSNRPIEYFDNKVFMEDSREFLKTIPDNSIDLVVTDPPYKITARGNSGTSGGMLKDKQSMAGKIFKHNDIKPKEYIPELFRVLKEGTHCYIMTNHVNLVEMLTTSIEAGFHFIKSLIWNKGNKIMGTAYMSQFEYILFFRKGKFKKINECGTADIIEIANKKLKENKKNLHDTEKPVALLETLIRNSSKIGDRVLDPFLGIGSAAIACKKLIRIFIGNELDKIYHQISLNRLATITVCLS